ncbi:SPX domain-containing protein 1-like protein [Tanacetum coccineum]
MKFGKSLSNQIEETLPEWRDKFLSYKELKKKVKMITPRGNDDRAVKRLKMSSVGPTGEMSKEEVEFVEELEKEVEKFNSFFVEKEEEYIIKLKELQDSVMKAKDSNEEMIKIRKEIVDFHGEMVLLENYSSLNYTGIVKILKKYDKRTGALLRLPFIQKVLQEPFFTTDLLYKLVKECEAMLDRHFSLSAPPLPSDEASDTTDAGGGEGPTTSEAANEAPLKAKELAELEYMKSLYTKSTISALRALKEIRSKSSTVSVFSLPPLPFTTDMTDAWMLILGTQRTKATVRSTIETHFRDDPTVAAALLRLHFHDCFVERWDGSILIKRKSDKINALPNLGLRGFEVIDDAKTQLEALCPGVVLCADILALAARESVDLSDGPNWAVPTGRYDG